MAKPKVTEIHYVAILSEFCIERNLVAPKYSEPKRSGPGIYVQVAVGRHKFRALSDNKLEAQEKASELLYRFLKEVYPCPDFVEAVALRRAKQRLSVDLVAPHQFHQFDVEKRNRAMQALDSTNDPMLQLIRATAELDHTEMIWDVIPSSSCGLVSLELKGMTPRMTQIGINRLEAAAEMVRMMRITMQMQAHAEAVDAAAAAEADAAPLP